MLSIWWWKALRSPFSWFISVVRYIKYLIYIGTWSTKLLQWMRAGHAWSNWARRKNDTCIPQQENIGIFLEWRICLNFILHLLCTCGYSCDLKPKWQQNNFNPLIYFYQKFWGFSRALLLRKFIRVRFLRGLNDYFAVLCSGCESIRFWMYYEYFNMTTLWSVHHQM